MTRLLVTRLAPQVSENRLDEGKHIINSTTPHHHLTYVQMAVIKSTKRMRGGASTGMTLARAQISASNKNNGHPMQRLAEVPASPSTERANVRV